jgi:hypothetical protein
VRPGLHHRSAEAPGPQRAAPAVAAVEGGAIAPAQALHQRAQRGGGGWRQQQQHLGGLQGIAMHRHAVLQRRFTQRRQELPAVVVVDEHRLRAVAQHQRQVGLAGHGQSGQAGHGGSKS